MFLTIESARLPCCTTFSRLPASSSITSAVCSSSCRAEAIESFNSWMSSIDSAAKLLTKFSADCNRADSLVLAHQRGGEHRSSAEPPRHCLAVGEFVCSSPQIMDTNRLAIDGGASHHPAAS